MKIVLCDYPAAMRRGTECEVERLKKAFPAAEIVLHTYSDDESLMEELETADGCITAFLNFDEELFSHCRQLKVVSVNATAFNTIDVQAATKHGVRVCALHNYCTEEVAEHTLAVMLALVRKLKVHQYRLERDKVWEHGLAGPIQRLSGQTLAIFGFGRIGQAVAKRARAFGLNILAVDPYLPHEIAESLGAKLVTADEAAQQADIITNHMVVTDETTAYFNHEFFQKLIKKPIFINMGRGKSVDENALYQALMDGQISSTGLDVLKEEQPNVVSNPLFGREDVIITPHSAFYSEQSNQALHDIPCDNLIAVLKGRLDEANYIINP